MQHLKKINKKGDWNGSIKVHVCCGQSVHQTSTWVFHRNSWWVSFCPVFVLFHQIVVILKASYKRMCFLRVNNSENFFFFQNDNQVRTFSNRMRISYCEKQDYWTDQGRLFRAFAPWTNASSNQDPDANQTSGNISQNNNINKDGRQNYDMHLSTPSTVWQTRRIAAALKTPPLFTPCHYMPSFLSTQRGIAVVTVRFSLDLKPWGLDVLHAWL